MIDEQKHWFSSDLHLGHNNIIKHCNRPFQNIEEMDNTIIENFNNLVNENDILWIIGDFSFRSSKNVSEYIKLFKCQNIRLIIGNHDDKSCFKYFEFYKDYAKIIIKNQKIILFHYPIASWDCAHHGSWHLTGHSHGKYMPTLPSSIIGGLSLDVGVDVHNFKPINFEQIKNIMNKKYELIKKCSSIIEENVF